MLSTMFAGGREAFDEVFAEGRRRDAYHFDLHWQAISLHCQKWYGSHEQMFAMARGVAAAAPAGRRAVLLPMLAHFEYALREFAWGTFHRRQLTRTRRYFLHPEVRQEVEQCIAKFRAGPPGPDPFGIVHQWMAVYYCLTQQRAQAKAAFDTLGQYVKPTVQWNHFWGGRENGYFLNWAWANGFPPWPGER